jgi:hypothetical protein
MTASKIQKIHVDAWGVDSAIGPVDPRPRETARFPPQSVVGSTLAPAVTMLRSPRFYRRLAVASLFGLYVAALSLACGEPTPAEADQTTDGAHELSIAASPESTKELGVVAWRIDFSDGRYAVIGLDERRWPRVAMQAELRESDGKNQGFVEVATDAFQGERRFSTMGDKTTFERDDLSGSAEATRILDLMKADLSDDSDISPSTISAIHPLDTPLVTSGPGSRFGLNNSAACTDESSGRSCSSIIKTTNVDCLSTAECTAFSNCGGSARQCNADQAWVRNLGCDVKCGGDRPLVNPTDGGLVYPNQDCPPGLGGHGNCPNICPGDMCADARAKHVCDLAHDICYQ